MPDLRGARVGLLEARMSSELADMVRRHGGEPVSAPSVVEVPLPARDDVAACIDALTSGDLPFVVFLTGVGASALIGEAAALGRDAELIGGLRRAVTICRGPKPAGVLARVDVPVGLRVPSPHTTADVIRAIEALAIAGRRLALVHHGERNEPLTEALRARGAIVDELFLYEWRLPADVEPLRRLAREAISGGLDAVAFTSQIQVRHLLQVADDDGGRAALVEALNDRLIVAAIGPTCAAVLRDVGITPRVVPDPPKLGPMLAALAAFLETRA